MPVPPEPLAVKMPGEVFEQIGLEPPVTLPFNGAFTTIVLVGVFTVPHAPLVMAQYIEELAVRFPGL